MISEKEKQLALRSLELARQEGAGQCRICLSKNVTDIVDTLDGEVDKVTYVDNANKELSALSNMQLRHEAVADKKFSDILGGSVKQEGESMVTLKVYGPNHAEYEVNSTKGGVVVFSEIYYPGWTATVDGEPVEVGRVNYVLRAIKVKPGNHKVILNFDPQTVKTTEVIAYIAYALLILVIALLAFKRMRKS